MSPGEFNVGGNPAMEKHLIREGEGEGGGGGGGTEGGGGRGVEILLAASCYRSRSYYLVENPGGILLYEWITSYL